MHFSIFKFGARARRFYLVYEGTSHSYKVPKLKESMAYTFRICARNEVGEGPYSDEVVFLTTRAPPPTLKSILNKKDPFFFYLFHFDPHSRFLSTIFCCGRSRELEPEVLDLTETSCRIVWSAYRSPVSSDSVTYLVELTRAKEQEPILVRYYYYFWQPSDVSRCRTCRFQSLEIFNGSCLMTR